MDDNGMKTVVAATEVPLSGPLYDGTDSKISLEVRDFGEPRRSLVIRTLVGDAPPITTVVRWDVFTDALDTMRAEMMQEDWDEALLQITGGTT